MRFLANSSIGFVLTCLVNKPLLANSAFVVNLLEESGTLVSHPASPTRCRLILTHSLQGQINYSYPCLFKQLFSGAERTHNCQDKLILFIVQSVYTCIIVKSLKAFYKRFRDASS